MLRMVPPFAWATAAAYGIRPRPGEAEMTDTTPEPAAKPAPKRRR
jgi:hypothetical protein